MNSYPDQQFLLLDGYNFFQKFYDRISNQRSPPNHWNWNSPFRKVKRFVQAVEKSGFILKVFIDGDNVSKEALTKWTTRRKTDVRKESNTLPAKAGFFLGMFFRRCRVEVHYSFEEDNDDTIAAYAQHYQAVVLSADRDFFRYRNRNYEVYCDFEYTSSGTLRLIPNKVEKRKPGCKLRDICSPLPKTIKQNYSKFRMKLPGNVDLRMGCPTQLVKSLGNPHLALRPLRQAAYYRFRIEKKIEYIPYWDQEYEEVGWDVSEVKPDKKYMKLLENPYDALEEIFMLSEMKKPDNCSDVKWGNHIFSIIALTYDICSMIYDKSDEAFFDWMEDAKLDFKHIYSKEESKKTVSKEKQQKNQKFEPKTQKENNDKQEQKKEEIKNNKPTENENNDQEEQKKEETKNNIKENNKNPQKCKSCIQSKRNQNKNQRRRRIRY